MQLNQNFVKNVGNGFQIGGKIIAPRKLSDWRGHDISRWLSFRNINGLIVDGNGTIDGRGVIWWKSAKDATGIPTVSCIFLASISNLHIIAPETSHNTDGIDISSSSHVQIRNCFIGTGDDCVAINSGCSNISISGVVCGPGHEEFLLSVGSLGKGGADAQVQDIRVEHCIFNGTLNGARIKTWQKSAVNLSGISFMGFRGTSLSNDAIKLSCSKSVGCTNILLDHINIKSAVRGTTVYSSCINAHGRYMDSFPKDWNHSFRLVLWLLILRSSRVFSQLINVMDYGAVGDGMTDDSQAFMKAWIVVCGARSSMPVLNVPTGRKFLLKPSQFGGPCNSPNVHFQVGGTIVGPSKLSDWRGHDISRWLSFRNVNGLIVDGNGLIDGQGAIWWKSAEEGKPRPLALGFSSCNNLKLSGLTHINSPRSHISIDSCTNITITNLHIIAPKTSPNTDGLDISSSSNVQIQDCYIGTGDDCIAINSGCNNINISGVDCGPGHGISVGSLGEGGAMAEVEDIRVENCTFNGTQNGARIKTWQESAVKLSDISFMGFRGTSLSDDAINLSCSKSVGCTNILLDHINITSAVPGEIVYSSCINAHGRCIDSIPKVDCLLP
ncbi:probable polygalacturonase At3g15720 [Durio zibethinus]|uniref:Probable polygalacturonase At3g15720 n=1 Tax=Durio zibethinus TaxID=66656 RepID=A0A6P5WKT7_DURZI|nr:probable polygalacturonase At3g15720 [Durio zibethinus]